MMAAVMEKHVEMPVAYDEDCVCDRKKVQSISFSSPQLLDPKGGDAEPELEDNDDQSGSEGGNEDNDDQSGSEGGNEEERSDDGGSNEEEADDADDDDDDDDDDDGDKEEGEGNTNAGWAEAMAKILGKKTAASKSIILVKNKELDKMKERERQEQQERKKQVDEKRSWEMMSREKPDIVVDRETERALQRIATRGVVQLFNAVKKHQKNVDDKVKEVGGSERKKAKILGTVSKRDFIDVLRRTEEGPRGTGTPTDTAAAAEEKPAWSALRDDFMMGATMKDWDKDSDKEETEP